MAGSLSRRDIEMIFRADTDKATRPIAELGKAVKQSRRDLESLVDAAEKGEVSLDKLGATTRDLKKAQDELGTARSLLTSLNSQETALERAEERAAKLSAKYDELKAAVAAADSPTKGLVTSMERAGRASAVAGERLEKVRAEAAETREQITGIIGPVDSLAGGFRTIASTSAEIARGLAVAGAAADDFKQKITAAKNASAMDETRLNADVAFEQQGRSAGLLQSQIDYISQFENRVELLAQAKRELAAQDAAFDKALSAQAAKEGVLNTAALERQIRETFAAADQAEQINAFRQIANDARAGVADVSRFGVAEDEVAASSNRLATALSSILSPSAAVNRTLDAIEQSVIGADAALKDGKKSAAELNAVLNDLSQAGAGIERIARSIDTFRDQEAAVARARAQYDGAVADVNRLAGAIDAADAPTAEMVRELRQAETAVKQAGDEMQRQATKAAELSTALKRTGVDVDDLATAERRLTAAARETAAAGTEVQARQGGKGGLFGLTPTDATNLSYQINDIFTQLASGQSIFITLAQQGPQIWQIGGVQAYASSLSGLLIPLAAVAGGFGLVAAGAFAVYKATSPDANTQAGQAFLATLGDTAGTTAEQYGQLANRLEDFGLKSDEARDIAQRFVKEGLDPSFIGEYTQAIKDAADATGVDMPTAANALTDALTGGYDAVLKLNEQFPVLTDAELEQIKTMYESGQVDEARQLIFDRYTDKMADAADKMNGPWSNAWDNLKAAAARFGNYISGELSTFFSGLRKDLDEAAVGVNYLLLRFRGLNSQQAAAAAVNGGRAPTPQGRGNVAPRERSNAAGREAADEAEREQRAKGKTAKLEDRIAAARAKARKDAQAKGYGVADEARLMATAEAEVRRVQGERDSREAAKGARKAKSARDKAAREAASAAKRIDTQQEQLQTALEAMGVKVAKVAAGSLEDQMKSAVDAVDRQYAKLRRQLADFSGATGGRGKIGGMSIGQYRAQLDANEAILKNQGKLKVFEDNINDTLDQRKTLLAAIEDQAQSGVISNAESVAKTQEVTSRFQPIIDQLNQSAIDFARSIGGAKPSAEIEAFIAKLERQKADAGGSDPLGNRRQAEAAIGRDEANLNRVIAERNNLVEQYNTLAELGLITDDEARRRSAEAYNNAKAKIMEQTNLLRATLETSKASLDPQVYEAMIAKLKAVGAQAEYLDPRFAQLKSSIDGVITDNAMSAIDKLMQAMAQLATGAKSVGGFFAAAGRALLEFIAGTVLAVARLVIQALILKAVDSATGGLVSQLLQFMNGVNGNGGGGGGGGGSKGGGFKLFGLKLFHAGGRVGDLGGQSRTGFSISPAALAAVPRYHEGTPGVGLKRNEQVAVLERGEKVLTERQQQLEAQQKARTDGGGKSLRQVLAFGDDQVAAAMSGTAGEDVTITHIRRNTPLLKQLLAD